jgi:WD40 repeat protein
MHEPDSVPGTARLNEVLAAYYQEAEAGRPPDVREFIQRYPDLSPELASFFDARQAFEEQASLLLGEPPRRPACPQFGDYELLEELARGGMGVVYRARQASLSRVVALKMILDGQLASPDEVRRFRREAEAAAGLDHPHIVPIYEVGAHQGLHYYSMKLVEGGSLAEHVADFLDDPRAAARLLATVARAVHYAHQRGILHRDLKPANVLLDGRGQPHVADFGLARRLSAAAGGSTAPYPSRGQGIAGTPAYMAPEQAAGRGDQLTTATDVYALGVILYELLTGRPPFRASTVLKVLRRVLDEDPRPPRAVRAGADRELETVCLKCLRKEPDRRYPSALALAEDLERYLAGEPIQARPAAARERLLKWARRRPTVAALGGLLLLSTALGFGSVLFQWHRAEAARAAAAAQAQTEKDARDAAEKARHAAEAERDAKDEALRKAEALRLAAHAELVRPTNPGLSLVLAVEGARRHQNLLSNNALLAALDVCRERRTFVGHEGEVYGASFSADGRRVLTNSEDNTARLWDAGTGKELAVFRCPQGEPPWEPARPVQAHLSADGRRALTVSARPVPADTSGTSGGGLRDHVARLWAADTGRLVATWELDEAGHAEEAEPFTVSFSPDGRRAAVTFGSFPDTAVRVYETEAGKELFRLAGHRFPVVCVAYSPDGRRIATASLDGTVRLWDAGSGKLLRTLEGHRCGVCSVAFSPDGRRLLTAADGATHHFEVVNGGSSAGSSNGSDVPEGSTLARVWDAETGRELLTLHWPAPDSGFVRVARWSPDGSRILTAATRGSCRVTHERHTTVWDARTGTPLLELKGEPHRDVNAAVFSPDGRRVAVAGREGVIRLYDARTGEDLLLLRGHEKPVRTLAFSPDGDRLLSAAEDGTARLWDVTGSGTVWPPRYQSDVPGTFSPDGRLLYLPLNGSYLVPTARVLDPVTRVVVARGPGAWDLAARPGWEGPTPPTCFSPDSRLLAACPARGTTVELRDAATLKLLVALSDHEPRCRAAAFTPDGRRLFTADGRGRIWDAPTGKLLVVLVGEEGQPIHRGVFSPDGKRLLTMGDHPRDAHRRTTGQGPDGLPVRVRTADLRYAARLWDVETGKLLAVLNGHEHDVRAAAFSPDGGRLVTASEDETAVLWDAVSGQQLRVFEGHAEPVRCVAFAPDGKSVLTGSDDGTARLWDAETGRTRLVFKGHAEVEPCFVSNPGGSPWVVSYIRTGHRSLTGVAFSPDGALLLTAGADGAVHLWEAGTGKAFADYREPGLGVVSARFSGDGRQVLVVWTASPDLPGGSVARAYPIDLASAALPLRPREPTAAERERFEIEAPRKQSRPE